MKKLIYISELLTMLLVTSCAKETPCKIQPATITFEYLASEYKTALPYTGKEIVRYLKNDQDTLTFIGQRVDSGYVETVDQGSIPCPYKTVLNSQYFHYRYLEKGGKDSFEVFLYTRGYYKDGNSIATDFSNCKFSTANYYGYIFNIGSENIDSTFGVLRYQNLSVGYCWKKNLRDDQNVMYINRTNGFVHIKTPLNYYTLIK